MDEMNYNQDLPTHADLPIKENKGEEITNESISSDDSISSSSSSSSSSGSSLLSTSTFNDFYSELAESHHFSNSNSNLMNNQTQSSHQSGNSVELNELQCPKCSFVAENENHMADHIHTHTDLYKCQQCDFECMLEIIFKHHMKSHLSPYNYRCANCSFLAKHPYKLKQHLIKYNHTQKLVDDNDPTVIYPVIDIDIDYSRPLAARRTSRRLSSKSSTGSTSSDTTENDHQEYSEQSLAGDEPSENHNLRTMSMSNPIRQFNIYLPEECEMPYNFVTRDLQRSQTMNLPNCGVSSTNGETNHFENDETGREATPPNDDDRDNESSGGFTSSESDDDDSNSSPIISTTSSVSTSASLGERSSIQNTAQNYQYYCHHCSMRFYSEIMYAIHKGYHGYEDPFTCNSCGVKTDDCVAFNLHLFRGQH